MNDLISRQEAIKAIEDLPNCYNGFSDTFDKACIIGVLEEVQSAQRTGHWINRSLNIKYPEWERYTCSECGKHSDGFDYCPNCGADMRGVSDE